jgi:hypothetical protein
MTSTVAFAPSKSPGSFGGISTGTVVPVTPAFAASKDRDSAMEVDQAHQMAASNPLTASGVSLSMPNSSKGPQEADSAMHLDEPRTAASNLLTTSAAACSKPDNSGIVPDPDSAMELEGPQMVASKPLAASGASVLKPTTNGNASPFSFVFPHGSDSSTANRAGPQSVGGTMPARYSSQASGQPTPKSGQKISKAHHLGRVRKDFRDRSEASHNEIEACMHQVPDPYKPALQMVIKARVCDEVPAPSSETATSIPELANMGPGARVIPLPRHKEELDKEIISHFLKYFRNIRSESMQVWLDLITMVLRSGRTPKEMFGLDCSKVLGSEWVIDYARVDRVAREPTSGRNAFFGRENMSPDNRTKFDDAFKTEVFGSGPIFDKLVAKWALENDNDKALVMKCLEHAGWIRADSILTRFMSWSMDAELAPPAACRTCHTHFKWASPRLLHFVSNERHAMGFPGQLHE